MGKGMSEIQENPLSGVELIFLYDAAFDIDAGCNHICQMFFQILIGSAFFQKIKELTVFDASVFDDFSHTVCHITFRQGFQYIRIDQYHLRLVKGTYQILTLWKIDCNFSTNRRIYLCKNGSWNLHELDSSKKGRCHKSGKVSYHSTAKCNDQICSGNLCFQKRAVYTRKGFECF